MRTASFASGLSLCSLWATANAFPLLHLEQLLAKREPQSYSVVPVDGGQATGSPVQTVTDRIVQTSITTILSTLVLTQSNIPTTVVVTSTAAVTITQAAPPVTIAAPAETKTLMVGASMTSSPYDNGMWHTTYYSSWLVSSSAILPAPSSSSSSSQTSSVQSVPSSQTTAATSSSVVSPIIKPDAAIAVTTPSTAPLSPSAPTSLAAIAQTTNWATAYGQWHDKPNAAGSWWWK